MKPTSALAALVIACTFLIPGFSAGSPFDTSDGVPRAEPLVAQIAVPYDNATYKAGCPVTFIGWSNSIEDGTFRNFIWVFYKDGTYLMNVSSLDEPLVMPLNDTATYRLVLHVYNQDGDEASNETQIKVIDSSYDPPVPIISFPAEDQTFNDDRESYFFNGSESYDPGGGPMMYYYWYGFDGYWMGWVTEHTIWNRLPAGRYLQTLSVQGFSGLWNTTIRHFNVEYSGNNTPPVAIINAPQNNETFPVNTSVLFSSASSYDPDGSIVNRTWRITFRGTLIATVIDQVNFTYQFPVEGSYRIELFVTDDGGKERSTWMEVQIGGQNRPPVANIITPEPGSTHQAGRPVDFSSEGSYDPEGRALEYMWSFGDGETSTAPGPAHVFASPGEYVVALTVRDPQGLTGSATVSVFIVKATAPLRVTLVAPANGSAFYTLAAIDFCATAESDLGKPEFRFVWDFGDGTTGEGAAATHAYAYPGAYSILLRVTDGANTVDTIIEISVRGEQDRPPVAAISVMDDRENLTFPVNASIEFSGNGSYDPEGRPLTYRWAVRGEAAGTGREMTRSFPLPGDYLVMLEVSDGALNATAFVGIHIYELVRPRIVVPAGQRDVRMVAGVLEAPPGHVVRLEGFGGTAYSTYTWDFGDGTVDAGRAVSHRYRSPGRYNITCVVQDGLWKQTLSLRAHVRAAPRTVETGSPALAWALAAGAVLLAVGLVGFLYGTELGLGLLFPLFVFLYSKISRDEILDNFLRGRISGYIVANPGDNYSSIRDSLNLSNGVTAFHLRKLLAEGVIKARADGVYKRFYPAEMRVPEPNGGSLSQVQSMVFDKILETPGISQKDIAGVLNVSSQVIGYHAEALVRKGRVRRERRGITVRYYAEETTFEEA
jgi:PKD repeat protein